MLFHNGFVTSTVCAISILVSWTYASRTSESYLHENPDGHQAFPAFNMGLEANNLNVAGVLSKAGYRTGFVGKYHASGIDSLRTKSDYKAWGLKYIPRDAKRSHELSQAFRYNEIQYRKLLTSRGFHWAKKIYLGNMEKPYSNTTWNGLSTLDLSLSNSVKSSSSKQLHLAPPSPMDRTALGAAR